MCPDLPTRLRRNLRSPWTFATELLAVALVATVPFLPWLLGGRTLAARDTGRLYAPLRSLVVDALRSFRLPLWNPYEGGGKPLLAEGFHGVLHPVSIAAAWLAPRSVDMLLLAYLATAAAGAYLLASRMGRSRPAAVLTAGAYALSGFVASMTENQVFLAGAATLPWVLASLHACARPGRWPVLAVAAAVAASLFAGDAQSAMVGVLLGGALAVEAGGRGAALRAVAGVALGVALAAVQVVPSAVHFQRTVRMFALQDWEKTQWALSFWRLVEFASPGFFGSDHGILEAPVFQALDGPTRMPVPFANSIHLGVPVLLLAMRGAWADRTSRVLAVATLLLLWLAIGHHAGAVQLLGWVPVWGGFRYTEKLVGPLSLCAALLAARGLDRDLGRDRFSWIVPGAMLVLVWGLVLLAWPVGEVRSSLLSGYAIAAGGALLFAAAMAIPRLPGRGWVVAAVVWVVGAATLPWAVHPQPTDCPGPAWLAKIAAPPPGPRIATPNARDLPPGTPGAFERAYCLQRTMGVPAWNAEAPVDQIDIYTGLDPVRFLKVFHGLGEGRWRAFRRFSLTHVVTQAARTPEEEAFLAGVTAGATPVMDAPDGEWRAWAVPHRAWASFAPSVSSAPNPQGTLDRLVANVEAGSEEVVIQADAPVPAAGGEVLAIRRGREWSEIDLEAQGEALLVVNDAFWPGWQAWVNGREVKVLAADVLVRGIAVPAGRSKVRLTYDPPEVKLGVLVSVLAVVVFAGVMAETVRRRRGHLRFRSRIRR